MFKKFKKFFLIIFGMFLFSIFSVLFYRFVPIYYTPLMIIRYFEKDYPINHHWVSLDKISKSMSKAVVKSEDGKFYEHKGFDFEAIKKANAFNQKHKKKKGASTISQQTAKNVFLWPARSYIRKGVEAYFTVLIELFWPKSRIMEAYLNVVELGPGIYGVEAAAQKFFHKKALKLSLSESALLAAVLPNPIKFRVDKPSAYILRRRARIIGRTEVEVVAPLAVEELQDLEDESTLENPNDLNLDN